MEIRQVLRQERKFRLDAQQRMSLEGRFRQVLKGDVNNGRDGYMVRSLYFDTLADRDFFEKMGGVETRRKMRLRIYSPDADVAYLEMKQKQGANQAKRSLQISRGDAELLMKGVYHPLLAYQEDFAAECYGVLTMHLYRPKVLVEYLRKAYVLQENSTRITFDGPIYASPFCGSLFQKSPGLSPIMNPSETVLEVKYNHFLPGYVKNMLAVCDRSETSVSKYALARQCKTIF
ncbi:MAG: polyphosphate polymerase domain-containing protein [Oscillospiraceae bacterium]